MSYLHDFGKKTGHPLRKGRQGKGDEDMPKKGAVGGVGISEKRETSHWLEGSSS